jgi:hypothetical protein
VENLTPPQPALDAERTLIDPREALALVRQFAQDLERRPGEFPLSEATRRETVVAVGGYVTEWQAEND